MFVCHPKEVQFQIEEDAKATSVDVELESRNVDWELKHGNRRSTTFSSL